MSEIEYMPKTIFLNQVTFLKCHHPLLFLSSCGQALMSMKQETPGLWKAEGIHLGHV